MSSEWQRFSVNSPVTFGLVSINSETAALFLLFGEGGTITFTI